MREPKCLCGECTTCKKRVYQRMWRARNREQYNAYKRNWKAANKDKVNENWRKRYRKNPAPYIARAKVQRALRSGKLTKTPCECCGEEKVQAHHHDYDKPLEVQWLCRKCHTTHHYKSVERDWDSYPHSRKGFSNRGSTPT